MVMLARALSLDPELTSPRMILVTDRKDLDKQLGNTFAACGLDKERATSGRNLIRHIKNRVGIITTLINKFDKVLSAEKYVDDSADIIVLVDESHRTNFGSLAVRMRQMLPNACYIGFTGTPLLKEEKNSFARFGGLIEPHYSVRRAITDKAVVPLLYEGRHVEMEQNQAAIDLWFARHTEDQYNKQIIAQFKNSDKPEILIVVDKLITGFDAPRNSVLYLCRKLREHTLLQAIARVNRLYEGKEFGYIIDYANVLGELDKALHTYDALAGFDGDDLADFLTSIHREVSKLPQHYSDLWSIFKEIKNSRDEERYEVLLADDAVRDAFYERLTEYSKTLAIALSAEQFIMQTNEAQLNRYKNDLKRFQKLRLAVQLRYAETISYRDYEPRIKRKKRISDLDYLQKVSAIRDEVANTQRDDVPDSIRDNEEASAYFGAIKSCLTEVGESRVDYVAAETALAIKSALEKNWKVDFWNDSDAQNVAKNEMDDFFYDVVKDVYGIDLSSEQMDEMISFTSACAG